MLGFYLGLFFGLFLGIITGFISKNALYIQINHIVEKEKDNEDRKS